MQKAQSYIGVCPSKNGVDQFKLWNEIGFNLMVRLEKSLRRQAFFTYRYK